MRAVYVAKPLTTTLIIALAMSRPSPIGGYREAIAAGLVCSLAGDVLLMLPSDRFVAG
ncbi:MAG: lysoplasmalogenase, partial [Gemmatimonadetes bacterium]|nr:lysoplasmalogenase [Gemmatimonadota bacterium]